MLAVRAARLLPLADCSVQCARQQLFTVHSDAAFGAHVPELIKAARCVHVLSHGHAVSVTVRSMLCVSFPCAAKLVQLSSTCAAQACCRLCVHAGASLVQWLRLVAYELMLCRVLCQRNLLLGY